MTRCTTQDQAGAHDHDRHRVGRLHHRYFRVARSREDVVGQRDAIAAWARMSYGWLGRSPTTRPR